MFVYLKHVGDVNRDADSDERQGRISNTERLAETGNSMQYRSLRHRAGEMEVLNYQKRCEHSVQHV